MVKDPPTNAGDAGSIPGWRRSHGVKGMAPHSNILAWKIHAQSSLAGYSPWGHTESDMMERLSTTAIISE